MQRADGRLNRTPLRIKRRYRMLRSLHTFFVNLPATRFSAGMLLLGIFLVVLEGCSSRRDSAASVGMQNLTAHFNFLYNARESYKENAEIIIAGSPDDFSQLLSVYPEPAEKAVSGRQKALDSILYRTNRIVNEKEKSRYVDDAWMLTGKVNYLKTDFYNAVEYFSYVYRSYPKQKELRRDALVWQARSLLRLRRMEEAARVLDTAIKYLPSTKYHKADVLATEAQFSIYSGNLEHARKRLVEALAAGSSKKQEIRWTYLLAQLEERAGMTSEALAHYGAVVRSNTSFEMAFNANLNKIRLTDEPSLGRITRLRKLLRQDKNSDFRDQVYYRIAELYDISGDREAAAANYRLSVASSTRNDLQKGLSFGKLADINFNGGRYPEAKAYYDSTLLALSPGYPGYTALRAKSVNLDFLAERYRLIAWQDTLRDLAALSAEEREKRVDEWLGEQGARARSLSATAVAPAVVLADPLDRQTEGKFYFDNSIALAQGAVAFNKRWGNRKPEDNWRRLSNSSTVPIVTAAAQPIVPIVAGTGQSAAKARYLQHLPVTNEQQAEADRATANAYLELAGFYKDEMNDVQQALSNYLTLVKRFPLSPLVPAAYYQLYRLYIAEPARALEYRQLLLNRYPETVYAKVLLDPEFMRKADEKALAFNQRYTEMYTAYERKDFREVLHLGTKAAAEFNAAGYSAQFAYLEALATGRTRKLDVLEDSLRRIVQRFPNDQLVTPLVIQHLDYIGKNRELLAKRMVALIDSDGSETLFSRSPMVASLPGTVKKSAEMKSLANRGIVKVATPSVSAPAPSVSAPAPSVSLPSPSVSAPAPSVSTPSPSLSLSSPTVSLPAPSVSAPSPSVSAPAPSVSAPAPPVSAPAPSLAVALPVVAKPMPSGAVPGSPAPVAARGRVVVSPSVTAPATEKPATVSVSPPKEAAVLFALPATGEYYFVVNVLDGRVNLSPSRFGIGQFNRSNYSSSGIAHQLREVNNENQLIMVGKFGTLAEVKGYEQRILPLLRDIMKVPAEKYNTFAITKEELDKLHTRAEVTTYMEFYRLK